MRFCTKCALIALIALNFFTFSQQFDSQVFKERRDKLASEITDGIIVMQSAPVYNRNGDVDHDYRQSSDFYYLTGFEEPHSALIIDPLSSNPYSLYVQEKNPMWEVWTGPVTGTADAVSIYGANEAFDIKDFKNRLEKYIKDGRKIYYSKADYYIESIINKAGIKSAAINDRVAELRLFKSAYEIEQLQRAIDITGNALIESMKACKPGIYEYQLQAVLEYNFRIEGSVRNGFPSIVGSGPNSTTLHYETNRRMMEDGDMVVMDVGAEYGFYSADVTRTFPVNGKFTPAQKRIYSIVLAAQKEAIKFIKPGVGFNQVDSVARSVVKKGLETLGLQKEGDDEYKFFMHGTSHWLGLDVHDAGSYKSPGKNDRILEPGMVLTVEPGIYIKEGTEGVSKENYNIGVRIEDDILVTNDGYVVLSDKAPKEINEIERLMSE